MRSGSCTTRVSSTTTRRVGRSPDPTWVGRQSWASSTVFAMPGMPTHVATVREGRIVCNEYFWDHAEALKAVGLEE
jgi:hypothetical protein